MLALPNTTFCIYPGVSQYTGDHWLKWGMQWMYGVDYTHAWIGFRLGGISLVYHSTGFGVHVKDWRSFQNQRVIKSMWEVQLSEGTFQSFVQECFQQTGKKYSNRQLFGITVAKLLRLKELPFGVNRNKEHVCSETAGRMLVKYTPASFGKKNPDLYTPKDFHETCEILETNKQATRMRVA